MQILCSTDFSPAANEAADVAAALAKKLGVPLRLIHCEPDWVAMGELAVSIDDDTAVREQLAEEAARLRGTGAEVVFELRRGREDLEIAAAAGEHPTRLVVVCPMGEALPLTHGPEEAARTAPVPTLIVRRARPLLDWLGAGESLRVVCGVDFTVSADAGIAYLHELAALGPLEITAAYISANEFSAPESRTDYERDVWDRLHTVLSGPAAIPETPLTIHVRAGEHRPAQALADYAQGEGMELIVVGAHQRSGWQRLWRSSFSHGVIERAQTNVLCVPLSSYHPPARMPAIHRVLVATDFSECGNDAIRHAYGLVHSGGEVCLLNVCVPPPPTFGLAAAPECPVEVMPQNQVPTEAAERELAKLRPASLATSGITTSTEVVVSSDVAGAICEAAKRMGADAICLGTTGHSRVRIALIGSTVQALLSRSPVPVYVVTRQPL